MSRLEAPVLTVDGHVIHKMDTDNPQVLFSMWTLFSKCAKSVEEGRRLENLSWRFWNRAAQEAHSKPSVQPRDIVDTRMPEMPQLSGSVDSVADDEAVDFSHESVGLEIVRPKITRQDSCASSRSRGRDRPITSGDLEKMVVSIIQKGPLTAPLPQIPIRIDSPVEKTKAEPRQTMERSGSTTTEREDEDDEHRSDPSEAASSPQSPQPTVVRGFTPGSRIPSSRTVTAPASSPESYPEQPRNMAAKPMQPKKSQPMFALGASSVEDSDTPNSVDARKATLAAPRRKVFVVGGSSEEENSLKSALRSPRAANNTNGSLAKKTASFSSRAPTVVPQTLHEADSDDDDVDESAIDDDDDESEWESSNEESGKSSIDEKTFFKRVDSTANLVSRRSLITLGLAHADRAARLGNGASQSTSALPRSRTMPNGPSMPGSPSTDGPLMMMNRASNLRPINESAGARAQPIMANVAAMPMPQAALSPRATRKNMLATELTQSLRRHLLHERQQKNSTATAHLRRRHTSHDVANLREYPQQPCMNRPDGGSVDWDNYFHREGFSGGYHTQGW